MRPRPARQTNAPAGWNRRPEAVRIARKAPSERFPAPIRIYRGAPQGSLKPMKAHDIPCGAGNVIFTKPFAACPCEAENL